MSVLRRTLLAACLCLAPAIATATSPADGISAASAQIGTAMDEMLAIANAHLTGQTRDNFIRAQIRVMEAVADLSRSALLSTMSSLKQVLEQKLELDACKAELNRTTY